MKGAKRLHTLASELLMKEEKNMRDFEHQQQLEEQHRFEIESRQLDRINISIDRLCDRYKNLSDGIGYLQIQFSNSGTLTAMTDGFCITFNPYHVEILSDAELDSLVMHEILHIIDHHFAGGEGKDPYLWNIACDFRVNSILRRIGMPMQPMALDNDRYDSMDNEEIYRDLEQMRRQIVGQLDAMEQVVHSKIKAIKGKLNSGERQ